MDVYKLNNISCLVGACARENPPGLSTVCWRKVEEIGPSTWPATAPDIALETRTARARLRIRRTPYFAKIAKGLRLGYYRGAVAGSWVARYYRGAGVDAIEALGIADDTLEADGVKVLNYWQAQSIWN